MSTTNLDMATALDITMSEENEAKFLALKNLHAKKLKSLMNSIDIKDKEIAKYKILDKAGPQAKIIQELKKKIRTQETINDILKKEMIRHPKERLLTLEELNQDIIRITLAGPERFRPLSREELENKIIDLERKNNALIKKQQNNNNNTISNNTTINQDTKETQQDIMNASANTKTYYNGNYLPNIDAISRFVELVEAIDELKRTIESKNQIIDLQKEEIIKLKSRNSQLVVIEENLEETENKHENFLVAKERIMNELEKKSKRCIELEGFVLQVKSDIGLENEVQKTEILGLNKQIDKYKQQVTMLLANIATVELNQEENLNEIIKNKETIKVLDNKIISKDNIIKNIDDKLKKMDDKLKLNDLKTKDLEKDNTQIDLFKDQLREKNIQIKNLTRDLNDKINIIQKFKNNNNNNSDNTVLTSTSIVADPKNNMIASSIEGKLSEK